MHSKALSFAATMLMAPVVAPAQDIEGPSREELTRRRDSKLASEFIELAPWHTSYPEALDKAKAEEKLVFAYFSRSYIP
jgi:hypothetical protein